MQRGKGAGRPDRQSSRKRPLTELRHRFVDTAHGRLVYVFRGELLVHCSYPRRTATRTRSTGCAEFPESREDPNLRPDLARDLMKYDSGKSVAFDVELSRDGISPFFLRVYDELRRVGFGELLTYGELARRAGSPGAGRSVGLALRMNPFGPVIPSHRVIASDGSLGGFASSDGLEIKRRLLQLEGHKIGKNRIDPDDRALLASFRGM